MPDEEEKMLQQYILENMESGENLRYEDNWKNQKTTNRDVGYYWTGKTEVEMTNGKWYVQEHRFSRTTFWSPTRVHDRGKITGKRVTELNRVTEEEVQSALKHATNQAEEREELTAEGLIYAVP